MPYCFSRSYVKLQGHTALKIIEFDPDWSFPDCNSILNSPMAPKWCTKLAVALKRCPIVFQGHPSNFKVTRLWKSSNLTQIGRFQTNSSLNSPMDMKCCTKLETAKERCPIIGYCFPRSSIKFQGHTVQNITDFYPNWAFPDYRPVAAFKSLRFALLLSKMEEVEVYNLMKHES